MRKIKTIDDITKDGKVEFGEGYEFVSTAEEADAILMRSTDLHGYELPEGIRAIVACMDEHALQPAAVPASTTSPSRSTPRKASSSLTPPVPTATPSRSLSWACWCFRAAE